MSGVDLRKARKAAGLSQTALAQRAGISRHTVSYWENKPKLPRWGWAVRRTADVLGHGILPVYRTSIRARGGGVLEDSAWFKAQLAALLEREAQRKARLRVICGAKTRKGAACRNNSEPGKQRCKFHGGKSTGPRTAEGKARIAEAQQRRWAVVRQSD